MKKYSVLSPSFFRLDGGAMYGIIPKPLWNKVHPSDADNRIDLALRLLLIQTTTRNILIDTGIGDYHDEKFNHRFDVRGTDSPIEKCLQEMGLAADDITDLVISHLHFDHVGGIVKQAGEKFVPVFPKATLHLHQKHYEYAQQPTERDAGSFQKKYFSEGITYYTDKKQIHWIDGEEGHLFDDFYFKCSHGHTPFLLHLYDDQIIYLADLIPTSNHIHIPWVMAYDMSPGISVKEKRSMLKFIEEKNLTMIFEHDPQSIGGRVIKNEKNEFVPHALIKMTNAWQQL